MDLTKLKAIDVHVHAEVSCHDPEDPIMGQVLRRRHQIFQDRAQAADHPRDDRASIASGRSASSCSPSTWRAGTGVKRISNEEIAEAARDNSDIMIAFASIDPHKGKMGALEARRLIEEYGVKGFKFHPPMQDFHPYDRMAWPIYEVIAEYGLPAIFHTGHRGMGTGMKGGGGVRLK